MARRRAPRAIHAHMESQFGCVKVDQGERGATCDWEYSIRVNPFCKDESMVSMRHIDTFEMDGQHDDVVLSEKPANRTFVLAGKALRMGTGAIVARMGMPVCMAGAMSV